MQLSEAVQQFITRYITSIDQLEILLLLKENPDRQWTAEDVARALAADGSMIEIRLAELSHIAMVPGRRNSGAQWMKSLRPIRDFG
jgi:hypothetical protein